MHVGGYDLIAPALTGNPYSEAEALGSAVWLWMHAKQHKEIPLHALPTLLMPALKTGQFVIVSRQGKPVLHMSWARLSEEAEKRYIRNPSYTMPEQDWTSGENLWILDWVAPFGHTRELASLFRRRVFAGQLASALYHRGHERGMRILQWQGIAVMREEKAYWDATYPVSGV